MRLLAQFKLIIIFFLRKGFACTKVTKKHQKAPKSTKSTKRHKDTQATAQKHK